MYAKNLLNFITLSVDTDKGTLAFDGEDQIIAETRLTHDGKVVHPNSAGRRSQMADQSVAQNANELRDAALGLAERRLSLPIVWQVARLMRRAMPPSLSRDRGLARLSLV